MSFWDKVKDFVGIESDYYDDEEYYEDDRYAYKDEESDYSQDAEEKEKDVDFEQITNQTDNKNRREERYSKKSTYTQSSRVSNTKMIVSIREPLTYEDGKLVIDDIKSGKSVVLNLEMLEVDKKTQIFYFVSGGVYALNGAIQNVTKDIYVIVPEGTDIDGAMKEQLVNRSLYQV